MMMKKAVRNVFKNINSSCSSVPPEVKELLTPEHFHFTKIIQHGFPSNPTCMAFDPVQRLLAIGNKSGAIRLFGTPGVDVLLKHESSSSVNHIHFLINEGAIISTLDDDTLHLWDFRQKRPQIVQSLQFQKERVSCVSVPFLSKYLYVGTEKGNVHVVHIESFAVSGYVVNWNKAIEVTQKTHPGPVCHLSECPTDNSKLLIAYSYGTIVLWDLKQRLAEARFQCELTLKTVAWHFEGKFFICGHPDGSLTTWSVKAPARPTQVVFPHAKPKDAASSAQPNQSQAAQQNSPAHADASSGATNNHSASAAQSNCKEKLKPIYRVDWKNAKLGEEFIIFHGGLPTNEGSQIHGVTIIRGKKSVVLEVEHPIITFCVLCESPYASEAQNPYAIAVLQNTDLVVIDLISPSYPVFQNPYPMDLHDACITFVKFITDVPHDFIPAICMVGAKQKRQTYSEKPWPIKGGDWVAPKSDKALSYSELLITGHVDGSVRFWDASSLNLESLYRLRTSKVFDKIPATGTDEAEAFAVQRICLCPDSRLLVVAGQASHVTVYRFGRTEITSELPVLEVPITPSVCDFTTICDKNKPIQNVKLSSLQRQQSVASIGSRSSVSSDDSTDNLHFPVKVRGGPQKRPAGFQPLLVCLTPWQNPAEPQFITSLAVNSAYGLMAYGTEQGVALVDIVQHVPVLSIVSSVLYTSPDPFMRFASSKSPVFAGDAKQQLSANDAESENCDSEKQLVAANGLADGGAASVLPVPPPRRKSRQAKRDADEQGTSSKCPPKLSVSVDLGIDAMDFNDADPRKPTASNSPNKSGEANDAGRPVSFHARPSTRAPDELSPLFLSTNEQQSNKKLDPSVPRQGKRHSLVPEWFSSRPKGGSSKAPLQSSPIKTDFGSLHVSGASVSGDRTGKSDADQNDTSATNFGIANSPSMSSSNRLFSSAGAKLIVGPKSPRGGVGSSSGSMERVKSQEKESKKEDFSRSRSSSGSSPDAPTTEGINCLTFIESCLSRNDSEMTPSLWLGTSQGSVHAWLIKLPSDDQRLNEPVLVSQNGLILKQRGSAVALGFLNSAFCLLESHAEPWKDSNKDSESVPVKNRVLSKSWLSPSPSTDPSNGTIDQQYLISVSELRVKVFALPAKQCVFKRKFAADSGGQVMRADFVVLDNSPALLSFTSGSRIQAHSLPTLRCLFDIGVSPSDLRSIILLPTVCLSKNGSTSMTDSSCSIFSEALNDMLCDAFIPCNMPEAQKATGFFANIFSTNNQSSIDRQELFGETKGSKTIAKHIPGNVNLDPLKGESTSAAAEVARTRLLLGERGEKLGDVELRTQQMMESAKVGADLASELKHKMKNKKWYQF